MSKRHREQKKRRLERQREEQGAYTLTYSNGQVVSIQEDEYRRLHAAGRIPRGTMINHPGGWCVAGATIGDIFELD